MAAQPITTQANPSPTEDITALESSTQEEFFDCNTDTLAKTNLMTLRDKDPAAADGSDDVEILDDEPRSILMALVSQLTVGMDLHRVTLPTFVLETRSMCERITDFMCHPDLLMGIPKMRDPVERFIAVSRFFLAGWHIRPKGVKKPYNPVLGEFHRCSWILPDNTKSFYICEQVSHHPPISQYTYINPHHGVYISGDLRPKSRFLGNSAATLMQGSTRIKVPMPESEGGGFEEYVITFPNYFARGILFGTMYTELGDVSTIVCERTGLRADYEFKTRGVFSDKGLNCVDGFIVKQAVAGVGPLAVTAAAVPGKVVAQVSGKWSDELFVERFQDDEVVVKNASLKRVGTPKSGLSSRAGSPKPLAAAPVLSAVSSPAKSVMSTFKGFLSQASSVVGLPQLPSTSNSSAAGTPSIASVNRESLFNAATAEVCPKVLPVESEMEAFESQRLWKNVTRGIQTKNLDDATTEKLAIEDNQRSMCKAREDAGIEWKPRFYVADGDDWKFDIEDITKLDPDTASDKLEARIFSKATLPMHKNFWA
ncbi:hypothetical protein HDU98_011779 [Podochytrium sp. JEL0797]|nr:hypothetical protein HDU98_011779 [Podochytrium sp. JEL0797]